MNLKRKLNFSTPPPCNLRSIFSGGLCGVMAKVLDCSLIVREFELQLRYYVYFPTNTLEKGMKPLILSPIGCSSIRIVLELNNPRGLIYYKTKKPNQSMFILKRSTAGLNSEFSISSYQD